MITKVCGIYFSATGNTKKITETVAAQLAKDLGCPMALKDFTAPAARAGSVFPVLEPQPIPGRLPTACGRFFEWIVCREMADSFSIKYKESTSILHGRAALRDALFLSKHIGKKLLPASASCGRYFFALFFF